MFECRSCTGTLFCHFGMEIIYRLRMEIEVETAAERGPGKLWLDVDGFAGPIKPGNGPRRDPKGDFPTGPLVGTRLPNIAARHHDGSMIDVHHHRAARPAVVVFFRSAVW